MTGPKQRIEWEFHGGLLTLVLLLVCLTVFVSFLLHRARLDEHQRVVNDVGSRSFALVRVIESADVSFKSPAIQPLAVSHGFSDVWLVPSRPDLEDAEQRRAWVGELGRYLPVTDLPLLVERLLDDRPNDLVRGEDGRYYSLVPVQMHQRAMLLVVASEAEHLAHLDEAADATWQATLIVLILVSLVYLVVSRLVLRPFQRIRQVAAQAGRWSEARDRVSDSVADEYERMIAELRERELQLVDLNDQLTERAISIEQFNDHLVQSVTAGVITFDCDGRFRSANPPATEILALPESVVPGLDHTALLDGHSELHNLIEQTLLTGDSSGYRECTITTDRGRSTLGVTVTWIRRPTGERLGIVVLINDTTRLTELRAQLETSRRLAALGEMAGGLAHQVRNALAAISGYAKLARRTIEADSGATRHIAAVTRETNDAEAMIRRFLDFARPLAVDCQTLDLSSLLDDTIASFAVRPEWQDVTISADVTRLPSIEGDGILLKQAFANLIENACEACRESCGQITVVGRATESGAALDIRDTGRGIAADDLDRIFTPFFSTRPEGTGLGLPLVRKIIEGHGGAIRIDSRPNEGTTVRIELPFASAPQPVA